MKTNNPINLRKAVERKGVRAINILMQFGKLIKFDLFLTLPCAKRNATDGYVSYTITDAVKQYPQYFTYQ